MHSVVAQHITSSSRWRQCMSRCGSLCCAKWERPMLHSAIAKQTQVGRGSTAGSTDLVSDAGLAIGDGKGMPNCQPLQIQPTLAQNSQVPVAHILATCAVTHTALLSWAWPHSHSSNKSHAWVTHTRLQSSKGRQCSICPEHVVYASLAVCSCCCKVSKTLCSKEGKAYGATAACSQLAAQGVWCRNADLTGPKQ